MQLFYYLYMFIVFGGSWKYVHCTCVLESEFGFTLNCAFKKSSLFRVRNLGGVKAHVGLGFTVGDELGFSESLSNVEGNRRRSTSNNKFQNALLEDNAQKNMNSLTSSASTSRQQHNYNSPLGMLINRPIKNTQIATSSSSAANTNTGYIIPPFKPIPPAPERPLTTVTDKMITITAINATKSSAVNNGVPRPALMGIAVPAFQEIPASISHIHTNPIVSDVVKNNTLDAMKLVIPAATLQNNKLLSNIDRINLDTKINNNNNAQSTSSNEISNSNSNFEFSQLQSNLALKNISKDTLEAAILFRQQLLKQKAQQTSTTGFPIITTTTTTIPKSRPMPTVPKRSSTVNTSKVMNAPKEYYPVGYDKNFDDNFASKVELPETSFYCGEQKHFPGLYADEDLGCMVFHVCALTDDGLIMKSFLCPESTLFDQAALHCNWWFYTECKNSKKLYDSNIPISKSYQLMKALTYFSNYKKGENSKE